MDKTSNLTNYRADFQQPVLINYQQTLVNNYLQLIYDFGARVNCFATCGRATLVAYPCHLFAGNCTANPPHRAMAGPCFFYTLFKTGNKICQESLAWSSYLLCTCFVFASYLLRDCFVASASNNEAGIKEVRTISPMFAVIAPHHRKRRCKRSLRPFIANRHCEDIFGEAIKMSVAIRRRKDKG